MHWEQQREIESIGHNSDDSHRPGPPSGPPVEYDGSSTLLPKFVNSSGTDEPICLINESEMEKKYGVVKLPLDQRIVITLGIVTCVIYFGTVVGLVPGVAHVPADSPGRALLGTIILSSDLSRGIHDSVIGLIGLVFVYGLWHRTRWVWWYGLAFMAYSLVDAAFSFPLGPITVTIAMLFSAGIILWLLYRRQLFGIGSQGNSEG